MEPTVVITPAPRQPRGGWIRRTCHAVFRERRLPTRMAVTLDRALIGLGCRTKTICVGGCRVRVRRLEADEHYLHEVLVERAYNPDDFEIGDTDTVVDIGGNIGAFALHAAQQARHGKVVTVEPVAANFRLLSDNLARNRLRHVSALRAAVVGTEDRLATVRISPLGSGHHSLVGELAGETTRSEQVEALRLDELFERFGIERCDFLKIDCEGAEFEIVENMALATARRIIKLAAEYHTRSGSTKRAQADRLVERLEQLGFVVRLYTDIAGTNRGMIFAKSRFELPNLLPPARGGC